MNKLPEVLSISALLLLTGGCTTNMTHQQEDYSTIFSIYDCDRARVTNYKACTKAARENSIRKQAENQVLAQKIFGIYPQFSEAFVLQGAPVNQKGELIPYGAFTLDDIMTGERDILIFRHPRYFFSLALAAPWMSKKELAAGTRLSKVLNCGTLSHEYKIFSLAFYTVIPISCTTLEPRSQ